MSLPDHQIRTLVAMTALEPCCLCKGESDEVGLFFPDDAALYGAPEGKRRFLFYPICRECRSKKGAQDAVETYLRISPKRIVRGAS